LRFISRHFNWGWSAILLMLLSQGGCGSKEKFPLAPVSGQVTLNGNPLPNVSVTFQPAGTDQIDAGSGSFGKTDQDGRFTLELVTTGSPGAVVGSHRVTIATPQPEGSEQDDSNQWKDPIPAKYNTATTLTFEVPAEGTDKADFPLTVP
jgi:hypothetical protein